MDGRAQLPTSPSLSLWVNLGQRRRPRAAKKDVGKASAVSRLSYLSLRFKIGEPSCLATLKMT
jgi:hypothetical protein